MFMDFIYCSVERGALWQVDDGHRVVVRASPIFFFSFSMCGKDVKVTLPFVWSVDTFL